MKEPNSQSLRILVADDVESYAILIRTMLERNSYSVDIATDGEQCLEKVGSFAPSLIILDIMMPKIHGIEVLRRLKADPQTRSIGVIVCTAKQYKPDLDQVRELDAFAVIIKPFSEADILQAVERFFHGLAEGAVAQTIRSMDAVYLPQVPSDRCYYRFWGTRGSIPVSGQNYIRHGGNTPCLEIGGGGQRIIVDAGSGIRDLGLQLARQKPGPLSLLISHTHWDHIQGFPFFAPIYIPGFELTVYGAATFGKDLKSVFSGQLDRDYFPVQFEDIRARIEFRTLSDPTLHIGPFEVTWEYCHHPAATVAYKFSYGGKSLAYVSDNEFVHGYLGAPHTLTQSGEILAQHRPMVNFLNGVDVLLAEAQYTNEEYRTKINWGHSSLSNTCAMAWLAKVKRWVVMHHDPSHGDDFLNQKLNLTKEILRSLDYPIEVIHGFDGLMEYW